MCGDFNFQKLQKAELVPNGSMFSFSKGGGESLLYSEQLLVCALKPYCEANRVSLWNWGQLVTLISFLLSTIDPLSRPISGSTVPEKFIGQSRPQLFFFFFWVTFNPSQSNYFLPPHPLSVSLWNVMVLSSSLWGRTLVTFLPQSCKASAEDSVLTAAR